MHDWVLNKPTISKHIYMNRQCTLAVIIWEVERRLKIEEELKKLIRLLENCFIWESPKALIQTKLLTKGILDKNLYIEIFLN